MANPYTSVTVNSYNNTPPTDDGAATGANQVKWSYIKTKLSDPVKTALDSVNTNVLAAMLKCFGGGAGATLNADYTIVAGDQGKYLVLTTGGHAFTLPDATVVGNPWTAAVRNDSAGDLTLTPHTGQAINQNSANVSITLGPDDGGILLTDGANFLYIGTIKGKHSIDSGAKMLSFGTAPTGWTVDNTINDAGIKLVSGAIGADAGAIAFSSIFTNITIAQANLPSYNLAVNITDPQHHHTYTAPVNSCVVSSAGSCFDTSTTSANTGNSATGITAVAPSGGSGTALNFSMKTAQANRITKN